MQQAGRNRLHVVRLSPGASVGKTPGRGSFFKTLHRSHQAFISAAVMSLRERTRPELGIIEPCLPSPAKATPSGPGWLHEIKHDGFRIMARRYSAGVRIIPWR
jgi:ATP-dependent DNA ligase